MMIDPPEAEYRPRHMRATATRRTLKREDMKKLVERMPDGVVLSIDLGEVKLTNGQKTE